MGKAALKRGMGSRPFMMTAVILCRRSVYSMTLREEIRQFMVACEVILDRSVKVHELNHMELVLVEYYINKVAEKFPCSSPNR